MGRALHVVIAVVLLGSVLNAEQLKPQTVAAFDQYVKLSEQRMAKQSDALLSLGSHTAKGGSSDFERLKKGEVVINHLETLDHGQPIAVPAGLIHHWVGTVFIPGATLEQTISLLEDYDNQTQYYSPNVERSRLLQHSGNNFKVFLRLREKKVVTVVLNTDYDVIYSTVANNRASCRSISTRIAEVENPGEKNESEKPVGDDNGFLWRLNSYWRFEQADGGTYVQLEAISLTRDIPTGLGWMIGPFVTSIPRESLEFTLIRTREALMGRR